MRHVRRNMREPLGALGRWEAVRDEDKRLKKPTALCPRKEGWVKGCACRRTWRKPDRKQVTGLRKGLSS